MGTSSYPMSRSNRNNTTHSNSGQTKNQALDKWGHNAHSISGPVSMN